MLEKGHISIRMVSGAVHVGRASKPEGFEGLIHTGGFLAIKRVQDGRVVHINTEFIESYEIPEGE